MEDFKSSKCWAVVLRLVISLLVVFGSTSSLNAQTLIQNTQMIRAVGGKVIDQKGDPVVGAVVMIDNNFGSHVDFESTDRLGKFVHEFVLADAATSECVYTVAVEKKGFRTAHRMAGDGNTGKQVGMLITMRSFHEDANTLSQTELIHALAPRLRQLGPSDGLSPNEAKDYAKGVQEFLDRKHEDRAIPLFRKVVKSDRSCVKCRTMLALAELNWESWDDAVDDFGMAVNAMLDNKNIGAAEPMLAQGVLESWQHEPARAAGYLQEAVRYTPNDPLALQELGRAECQNSDWDLANETLQKAVDLGAGPDAHLLHAEALLWAGTADAARQELDHYLNGRSTKSLPIQVQLLSDRIAEKKKDAVAYQKTLTKMKAQGEEPLDYIRNPPRNLPNFEPVTDQSQLQPLLKSLGDKMSDVYKNLPNTVSSEKIRQEAVNQAGDAKWGIDQKFRYMCMLPQSLTGPTVDEYRVDLRGKIAVELGLKQNMMLTSGFLGAPLVFHPAYQAGSNYRLLGRQQVKGHSTFVLAFAQEPARSKIFGSFRDGKYTKYTYVQGLVWVDDKTSDIVRLKTDLLYPVPQMKLKSETTEIEFNEVPFASVGKKFWLPHNVVVNLDWSGRRLRNTHEYGDYLVFNVDEKNTIGNPNASKVASTQSTAPEQ